MRESHRDYNKSLTKLVKELGISGWDAQAIITDPEMEIRNYKDVLGHIQLLKQAAAWEAHERSANPRRRKAKRNTGGKTLFGFVVPTGMGGWAQDYRGCMEAESLQDYLNLKDVKYLLTRHSEWKIYAIPSDQKKPMILVSSSKASNPRRRKAKRNTGRSYRINSRDVAGIVAEALNTLVNEAGSKGYSGRQYLANKVFFKAGSIAVMGNWIDEDWETWKRTGDNRYVHFSIIDQSRGTRGVKLDGYLTSKEAGKKFVSLVGADSAITAVAKKFEIKLPPPEPKMSREEYIAMRECGWSPRRSKKRLSRMEKWSGPI